MKILTADDEQPALFILDRAIQEAVPGAELRSFGRASAAAAEVTANGFAPDVAFLDIEMPGISGLELARIIKTACPAVNIVFVTGFSQYAMDALAQRPSGYVMKPATCAKIREELENLRLPPRRAAPPRPLRIQCFGSFEVFSGGRPVPFLRAKCKELLAFLVDRRGAVCTAPELANILWDDGLYDRSRQKQLSVIRADLFKSLAQAGAEKLLVKTSDGLAVDPAAFDCDYYMALEGDTVAINQFTGEYMSPYQWAEYTTGGLVARYGGTKHSVF